jgi:hypothetical protein
MPKKFQRKFIVVERAVKQMALRFALSTNEVGLLFFGKENNIIAVIRIRNIAKDKRNFFEWDRNAYRSAIKKMITRGFSLVAEGHSHSCKKHLRRPSRDDLKYFKKGNHIIVFPEEKMMLCWRIEPGLIDFINSSVPIIIK